MAVIYCAICACPCHLPRVDRPPPAFMYGTDLGDTVDAEAESSNTVNPFDWMSQWHHLQVGVGIVTNPTSLPDLNGKKASSETEIRTHSMPSARATPIHHYCLQAVIQTIQSRTFRAGYSQEENVLISFSLPRVIGFGLWDDSSFHKRMGPLTTPGYWCGTASQRDRFIDGIEGSHLLPVGLPTDSAALKELMRTDRWIWFLPFT